MINTVNVVIVCGEVMGVWSTLPLAQQGLIAWAYLRGFSVDWHDDSKVAAWIDNLLEEPYPATITQHKVNYE